MGSEREEEKKRQELRRKMVSLNASQVSHSIKMRHWHAEGKWAKATWAGAVPANQGK